MSQISNITIPALVISYNNILFLDPNNSELVLGKLIYVPCRDVQFDNVDMWAIPIKDSGIFTGLDFELKNGIYLAQPTFDSFTVFQIKDKFTNDQWVIYGSKTDYLNSCATCCGSATVPMPGVSMTGVSRIAPCTTVNLTDANGNPYMVFGLPTLSGAQKYYPVGSRNNVQYTQASANGYATVALLLAFLNANWTPYVWTASVDGLTLIATGGAADDSLCISVIPFLASGS